MVGNAEYSSHTENPHDASQLWCHRQSWLLGDPTHIGLILSVDRDADINDWRYNDKEVKLVPACVEVGPLKHEDLQTGFNDKDYREDVIRAVHESFDRSGHAFILNGHLNHVEHDDYEDSNFKSGAGYDFVDFKSPLLSFFWFMSRVYGNLCVENHDLHLAPVELLLSKASILTLLCLFIF